MMPHLLGSPEILKLKSPGLESLEFFMKWIVFIVCVILLSYFIQLECSIFITGSSLCDVQFTLDYE